MGLAELHAAGVHHLDLSAHNIWLFSNCDLRIVNVAWEWQLPGLHTTDPKPFQRWYKVLDTASARPTLRRAAGAGDADQLTRLVDAP